MAERRSPDVEGKLLKEKKPVYLDRLAEELGVGVDVVKLSIEKLRDEGYTFTTDGNVAVHSRNSPDGNIFDYSRFFTHNLHFGVVSDTHLGSKKERLDALEGMYDVFQREGVHHVFHAGDLTDGYGVYKGQEFEVHKFGQDEQVQYAIETYPQRARMKTHFITGNHDLRQYEMGGIDPGVPISRERKDLDYLGQAYARVLLPEGVEMDLLHPGGGGAYALSYKAQKYINNLSPDDVPDILLFGHYHTSFNMLYRNVNFLQVPSFKDPGVWEKRLGLNSCIGGWVVDAKISDQGHINRWKPELYTFK